ncbi:sensor histidine kinase [Kitasatospora sp. GAS204B]|uniref:sensor histidine kinase n=1 Tax=unclassified Kitasatospora TaxID=2633591 RepID=UPI0024756698|nr:sensor histidine kinase [Kitasatospora sp. GAS204B]MDH6121282.1 signal transduction histidine kinase [Kitasatospora sp. GAS204B]
MKLRGDRRPEARALYGAQMWREARHHLVGLPFGILVFVVTVVLLSVGVGLSVTVIGLPVLALGLRQARWFGALARSRARASLGARIEEPEPLTPTRPGVMSQVLAAVTDGLCWRSVLYCLLMLPWGIITFTLTLVFLVAGWPLLPFVVRYLAVVHRVMVEALLGPGRLSVRVRELEEDRGAVVDTAAADLRRIERDLHDGAQARLVALAMDLGLAKEKLLDTELTREQASAARMVDAAHGEVKLALQELRDLARGIHPAVLTDRGLDAALSSVAARCTVPGGVRVNVDLAGPGGVQERPDSAVEGIAYFTVSELLTNTSKHAGARSASVDVWRSAERLMVQVGDDGRGGATVPGGGFRPGGGLAGLAERIGAVDGVFLVESPAGGPTTVTVELPWRTRTARPL